MALTDRQELFCQEYMKRRNATRAYLAAYGCSYAAAKSNATRLMENDDVAQRLDDLRRDEQIRLKVDRQRIIDEAAKIAFVNPADVIDLHTGHVRKDAAYEDIAAVADVRSMQEETLLGGRVNVSVKMYSKLDALRFLADLVGEGAGDDDGSVRIVDDICAGEQEQQMEMDGIFGGEGNEQECGGTADADRDGEPAH